MFRARAQHSTTKKSPGKPSWSPHNHQAMEAVPIWASALRKGEVYGQLEPAGLRFVFC